MFEDKSLVASQNEVSTASQSQGAIAEIQASFLIAARFRRNVSQARVEILESCARPKFAEGAIYKKPVGKKDGVMQFARGLSIRAAEEVIRVWGNIRTKVVTTYEDENRRKILVGVVDLQSNAGYVDEITIEKTKERRYTKDEEIISERKNSKGIVVYTLRCTPDDMKLKQAAEISKSLRNSALRLIPVDIKEEIEEAIEKTLKGEIKNNIKTQRNKISDAFNSIGISPSELEKYLNQEISTITESQIMDLRELYTSLKEGHTTWKALIDSVSEEVDTAKINLKNAKLKGDNRVLTACQGELMAALVEIGEGEKVEGLTGYKDIRDVPDAKAKEVYEKTVKAVLKAHRSQKRANGKDDEAFEKSQGGK